MLSELDFYVKIHNVTTFQIDTVLNGITAMSLLKMVEKNTNVFNKEYNVEKMVKLFELHRTV